MEQKTLDDEVGAAGSAKREPRLKSAVHAIFQTTKETLTSKATYAAAALTAAGLAFGDPTASALADSSDIAKPGFEGFSLLAGFIDGLLVAPNLVMTPFYDTTFARDGSGIFSEPSNIGYAFMYLTAGGFQFNRATRTVTVYTDRRNGF
jgi:hypothetical protein